MGRCAPPPPIESKTGVDRTPRQWSLTERSKLHAALKVGLCIRDSLSRARASRISFLLMYEDGLLSPKLQMQFILLQRFLDKYSGPFNTALLYTRAALLESFAYKVCVSRARASSPREAESCDAGCAPAAFAECGRRPALL